MNAINVTTTPLVLAPYVKVGLQGGSLYLGFGSIQRVFHRHDEIALMVEVAAAWKQPHTIQEIREKFGARYAIDFLEHAVEVLVQGRYLLPAGATDPRSRFSRHELFFFLNGADGRETQRRLSDRHVVILGCGGIGSVISIALATAGIGRLTLVDNDLVELSNLTRQFAFTEADVGRPKTSVLRDALLARTDAIDVAIRPDKILEPKDLESLPSADLLLLSADGPGLLDWTNSFCVRNGQPFLHVCYIEDIAAWGPLVIPGQTGCWDCSDALATTSTEDSQLRVLLQSVNADYQPPSFGPLNMVASSLAAMDALKYLGDFGKPQCLNRRVGLWTHDLRLEYQDFSRRPDCLTCGTSTGRHRESP